MYIIYEGRETLIIFIYRGLVKWYDRGLQNLWREFDSLIPCSRKPRSLEFTGLGGLYILEEKGTGVKVAGKCSCISAGIDKYLADAYDK